MSNRLNKPEWRQHLDALLAATPYVGHGGLRALARDLEVSYGALGQWRRGVVSPSAENRVRLAELYRLHVRRGEPAK